MLTPDDFFSLEKYEHHKLFEEVQYVWEALKKLNGYLQKRGKIEVEIPEGVYLVHPETISIGKGCVIEPGAYIQGPCIIGKNCSIRHGAYIRGNLVTGNNCVIGHATEVKNSIFLNDAHAAHFNYVGDSILGNGVNLGAGVKLANYRFDHQKICIVVDGKRIDTGVDKLGAIIGDSSQIGCNAVTNPGTLLAKKTFIHPCKTIGGVCQQKS